MPESHEAFPEVLTVRQVAELLQVTEETVRRLASKRELPGRRVGGAWRFSRPALIKWIESGQREQAETGQDEEDEIEA
jgi:excisionase family DNA binding protein